MSKKSEDFLKKIAGESPIAQFAESIKENMGIVIAGSVFEMQEALAEKAAAIKKYDDEKKRIVKTLATSIIKKAEGEHRKLLLIDSFTSVPHANEAPVPLLEHLLTKALQEDKGKLVFRADNVLVQKESIRAIDPTLLTEESNNLPMLISALNAICGGKIPWHASVFRSDYYAIRIGRINV